jgi:hypothetical protein
MGTAGISTLGIDGTGTEPPVKNDTIEKMTYKIIDAIIMKGKYVGTDCCHVLSRYSGRNIR